VSLADRLRKAPASLAEALRAEAEDTEAYTCSARSATGAKGGYVDGRS